MTFHISFCIPTSFISSIYVSIFLMCLIFINNKFMLQTKRCSSHYNYQTICGQQFNDIQPLQFCIKVCNLKTCHVKQQNVSYRQWLKQKFKQSEKNYLKKW